MTKDFSPQSSLSLSLSLCKSHWKVSDWRLAPVISRIERINVEESEQSETGQTPSRLPIHSTVSLPAQEERLVVPVFPVVSVNSPFLAKASASLSRRRDLCILEGGEKKRFSEQREEYLWFPVFLSYHCSAEREREISRVKGMKDDAGSVRDRGRLSLPVSSFSSSIEREDRFFSLASGAGGPLDVLL